MASHLLALLLALPVVLADVDRQFVLRRVAALNWTSCQQSEEFYPSLLDDGTETDLYSYFGTAEERKQLLADGWEVVSETEARPFAEINKEMMKASTVPGYTSPTDIDAQLQALTQRFPRIVSYFSLNRRYNTRPTVNNREIWAVKISNNVAIDQALPNVLIVSNHHARELITPEIALDTATRLATGYNVDPTITAAVNNNEIYILYTMNPDGLAFVWSNNNMWRKNRTPNAGGSFGVDQNRNYPIGWASTCGGTTQPTSETFRGVSSASEAETLTMLAFQADRNFAKVMDYHSYAREVRINYGTCASLPTAVDNLFIRLGQDIARTITGYRQARSCCMGGNVHSAYNTLGSLAFLTETGTAFQPQPPAMRDEVNRVWPGTLAFLNLAVPVSGLTRDTAGRVVRAQIELLDINFSQNERFFSSASTGHYHIWLPAGTWRVTFRAASFQPVTVSISVPASGGVVHDITFTAPAQTHSSIA